MLELLQNQGHTESEKHFWPFENLQIKQYSKFKAWFWAFKCYLEKLFPSVEVRTYVLANGSMGLRFPGSQIRSEANRIFISGGGSNSWRNRLWLFQWILKFCFWNAKFHHGVFHLHHRCKKPVMLIPAIQILFHMQKLTQRQVIKMHTSSHSIIQQFCRHTRKN